MEYKLNDKIEEITKEYYNDPLVEYSSELNDLSLCIFSLESYIYGI